MKSLALTAVILVVACSDFTAPKGTIGLGGSSQVTPGTFASRSLTDNGTTYPYQAFIPASYDGIRALPVILFLHGSGERGVDHDSWTLPTPRPIYTPGCSHNIGNDL